MSKYEKTAKDRAFDRERAKLGVRIRDLREELRKAHIQMEADAILLQECEETIAAQEKEIELLRNMLKLDKEELDRFISATHKAAEGTQAVKSALDAIRCFGSYPV